MQYEAKYNSLIIKHSLNPLIQRVFSCVLLLGILFSGTACSLVQGEPATPEAKLTVLTVVDQYLRLVAAGDSKRVGEMIFWSDYMEKSSKKFSQSSFSSQVASLKDRWPYNDHPLLSLELESVEIDGDDAEVTLIKSSDKYNYEIRVDLHWNSRGWVISNDSLFGEGELIDQLISNQLVEENPNT